MVKMPQPQTLSMQPKSGNLHKRAILNAIEYNKKKIIDFYSELLNKDDIEGQTQLERLNRHCKVYKRWWENDIIDLNKNSKNVTSSWLYEHEIFNLVAKYKSFDNKKHSLLFMGW